MVLWGPVVDLGSLVAHAIDFECPGELVHDRRQAQDIGELLQRVEGNQKKDPETKPACGQWGER